MNDDNEAGMTREQVVGTAYNVWRVAHGLKDDAGVNIPNWHVMNENLQSAWTDTVNLLQDGMTQSESVSARDFAQQGYYAMCRATLKGQPYPAWEELPPRTRLIWEAVVRHIANVLSMDEAEDFRNIEQHESRWGQWVENKLGVKV